MTDDNLIQFSLFEEPEDYTPPPPQPHFASYKRKKSEVAPSEISVRLVGQSPLWGHMLWNAGIYTADYLDKHAEELVRGKSVLELGAAAGLPSIICLLNECRRLVCTDYPDPELISNLKYNLVQYENSTSSYLVKGYIWGNDVRELLEKKECDGDLEDEKFDLIILSDVVFNHTEHHKLLKTCRNSLKRSGKCLVVFSPHRPKLLPNDLAFFETCNEYELKSEMIEVAAWKPMFEEDEETAEIRGRVYAYYLVPQW